MSDSHLHSGLEVDIVTVGGGGGISDLSDIPDLLQWYDASQVVGQVNDDRLSSIVDSSGNGYGLSAVSTGAQYKTAGINGAPSFFFSGSAYMMTAASRVLPLTDLTLVWVMDYSSGRPWGVENDGGGSHGLGFYSGGFIVRKSGASADLGPGPSGKTIFTYRLRSTGNMKGTATRNLDALGVNNSLDGYSDASVNFHLGSSGNGGSHFFGHIGEFASWSRCLTEEELGACRDILRAKYALWTI